jgi:hypothetical protein
MLVSLVLHRFATQISALIYTELLHELWLSSRSGWSWLPRKILYGLRLVSQPLRTPHPPVALASHAGCFIRLQRAAFGCVSARWG